MTAYAHHLLTVVTKGTQNLAKLILTLYRIKKLHFSDQDGGQKQVPGRADLSALLSLSILVLLSPTID